jgi:hypothetical protein
MADFTATSFGRSFFEDQMPRLIRAVERIAKRLDVKVEAREVYVILDGDEKHHGIVEAHPTLDAALKAVGLMNQATGDMEEASPLHLPGAGAQPSGIVRKAWRVRNGGFWRWIERHAIETSDDEA